MFQKFVFIVNLHYFRSKFLSPWYMQIQNLIYFNSIQFKSIQFKLIQLFSILFCFVLSYLNKNMFQNFVNIGIISGLTFFSTMVLGLQTQNLIHFNSTHMHTSYPERKIFDISKSADTTYSILFYFILYFLL